MSPTRRETCGCGARCESIYSTDMDKFREAHAPCREIEIVKQAWCRSDAERNAEHVKVLAAATRIRQELETKLERFERKWAGE